MAEVTFGDGTLVPVDGKSYRDPSNPKLSIQVLTQWTPDGVRKVLSGGRTGRIGLIDDQTVLKYPHEREDAAARKSLELERIILAALGDHPSIVRCLGQTADGLLLERIKYGDIRQYYGEVGFQAIPFHRRLQWALQMAEAVTFIHSRGVIHCDIHPNNFLIDERLNIRLCDFSGSLFGHLDGGALESIRYFLPREPASEPTIYTDLFALGSTLFFVMTGQEPYDTELDDEVYARFDRGEFPCVESIIAGKVILGCWKGLYDGAGNVVVDLRLLYNNFAIC